MATETDLKQLAATVKTNPYPFTTMGAEIATALVQAAEEQVNEAINLRDQAKVVAEAIHAQIQEQAKLNEDMNARLRMFGESILEAHHKFMNGKKK